MFGPDIGREDSIVHTLDPGDPRRKAGDRIFAANPDFFQRAVLAPGPPPALGPRQRQGRGGGNVEYERLFQASAEQLPPFDREKTDTLFVLNTANYVVTQASAGYAGTRPWPSKPYVLGATFMPIQIARPDAFTVRLTPIGGYMLDAPSQFVRAPEVPFSRGQTMVVGPLTARVEEVTPDGRPAAVSFRSEKLAGSNQLWVAWYGDRYRAIHLPKVGTEIEIPGL